MAVKRLTIEGHVIMTTWLMYAQKTFMSKLKIYVFELHFHPFGLHGF